MVDMTKIPLAPSEPVSLAAQAPSSRAKERMRELLEEEAEEMAAKEQSESPSVSVPKLAFGLKKASSSSSGPVAKKSKLERVFNMEDDVEQRPKKKLVPIDYSDDDRAGGVSRPLLADQLALRGDSQKISPEERKRRAQTLVNSIPTDKEEVFEYELKWEAIDKVLHHACKNGSQLTMIDMYRVSLNTLYFPPLNCSCTHPFARAEQN